MAFCGPGYLIAVGYIDPGNWATDLAGGSRYGYSLLWVLLLSNFLALLLQILSARLGIATGRDLAQACREHYSQASAFAQWILAEIAICATDLAEMIGMAIALKLLFGIPLLLGIILTALDVLIILAVQKFCFRALEASVALLMCVVFACFAFNLQHAQPEWMSVFGGLIPKGETLRDGNMLYLAIGILGATVMPHNLYLHSSTVQTRSYRQDYFGKREAISYATADIAIALIFALLVNAAILVTSAAVFHHSGRHDVSSIEDAYHLLSPLLGNTLSSALFGVALLASGQSSTITATLTGQIIMEGFTDFRAPAWARRIITRSIALMPAIVVVCLSGAQGLSRLLILSQVILSLQLPFAVAPLIRFTSDPKKMGPFVSARWVRILAYATLVALIALNACTLLTLVL
jgi:manganese transport protein